MHLHGISSEDNPAVSTPAKTVRLNRHRRANILGEHLFLEAHGILGERAVQIQRPECFGGPKEPDWWQ